MKNSVADRSNASPSCAGLFIGGQLGFNDFPGVWIHVDMAAPVHTVSNIFEVFKSFKKVNFFLFYPKCLFDLLCQKFPGGSSLEIEL